MPVTTTTFQPHEDISGRKKGLENYITLDALPTPRATTRTTQSLFDDIVAGNIQLDQNAEYGHDAAWPESKQMELIESIFRNMYFSPVVFAVEHHSEGSESKVCIGGKQYLISIQRFMAGLIYCAFTSESSATRTMAEISWHYPQDCPHGANEVYWFTAPPSENTKNILPEKYRRQFSNKQVLCIEYTGISDEDRCEIHQRVQLGTVVDSGLASHHTRRTPDIPTPNLHRKETGASSLVLHSSGTGDNNPNNGLYEPEKAILLQPESQSLPCSGDEYRFQQLNQCVSCAEHRTDDTCRFQNIRFLLKNKQSDIVGISFAEGRFRNAPKMKFPMRWNIPLMETHTKRMKLALAKTLLPMLKREYKHLKLPELIWRPRENEVRATCDTCLTSLSMCTWMCRLCGQELCAECYEQVQELTGEMLSAVQNSFLSRCAKKDKHSTRDFSPVSRFFKEELIEAIAEMEGLLAQEAGLSRQELNPGRPTILELNSGRIPTLSGALAPPCTAPTRSLITAPILSDEIRRYTYNEVSKGNSFTVFAPIWVLGEPIVVTGCLEHFKIAWTPQYFIDHYGKEICVIIECQSGEKKRTTVSEFFNMFGRYEGRANRWKLKDWPPTADFETAFPELHQDFLSAVPVPDYVRRDGVANISSHFPTNTIAPDLGPKMYNALASNCKEGSKGTTRLHLDMADALNILMHAENSPDGSPGCAVWDIFRSTDTSKLRTFLHCKFPKQVIDLIHGQEVYLDDVCQKELYKQFGVKSYRIYQRPGEAIFIPAGCAHQVANLADCIKVAIDFVSVENIAKCESLTREFRDLNQKLPWKEDVLQLKNMMWFAWLNCGRFEKRELSSRSSGIVEGVL
ncbi:hypothetical protein Agabi119p4_4917 [Agaricus bisporus var. burnettii]|uniref:JmjC domain-containing protein n=1 Tax=Agaricus bisporus var. burnettii TaxID=192524 RepID=A0A8H7F480_AGABI|nr:hypothetical protein Agabi119p4_4917 [Agaricus bisporus var. burnettii]